jgi:uncharacterized protein with beta-barrel porin domain
MNGAGNSLHFDGRTSLQYSGFFFNQPPLGTDNIVRFAGQTFVTGGYAQGWSASGAIEFTDQADTTGFTINGPRLVDVSGASTGTGTTGRQRATSDVLAATTVTANDARTVTLGTVNTTDLILGSNNVRLQGGMIYNIRDTGGAYRAADGSNLAGGGIIMAGGGYPGLILQPGNEPNPYAVPLAIESGTVNNYRDRLGAVTIQQPGSLNLNYTGTSGSIANAGRLSVMVPGYQVNGNFTQSSTGLLYFPVSNNGAFVPSLTITGQAALDGTLSVPVGGAFVGSRRLTLIRAGSVSGSFAAAPSVRLSPMLSIGIEYSPTEVAVAYTQRPFVNAGATASQQSLGAHLDANLTTNNTQLNNLLLRLNTLQDSSLIAAGLGQLAPDRYGVLNEQGFATAAVRQGALDRRLAGLRTLPANTGFVLFAEGGAFQHRFKQVDGLTPVTLKGDGGQAGFAWRKGAWTLGLAAGRDKTRGDLDDFDSRADIESSATTAFAQYQRGRYFIQGSANRTSDDYSLLRNSGLAYWPSMVSATPRGRRLDLALAAGAAFTAKAWSLTPSLGVLSSRVQLDDFAEQRVSGNFGSELAFTGWSVSSLRSRVGFAAARTVAGGKLTPRLSVAWLHEFENDRSFSAGLVTAGGARYRAPGRPAETDLVQATLGLDWRINDRLGFSLNAGAARGRNSDTVSDFSAGLQWRF